MKYRYIYIVLFAIVSILPVAAQDVPIDITINWNNTYGEIQVDFEFPDDFHQIHNTDFFYFRILDNPQLISGEILYPQGQENNGFIEYYGKTTLIRSFQVNNQETLNKNLQLEIAYQLCDEDGICYIPVKKIENISLDDVDTTNSPGESSSNGWIFVLMAFLGGLLLNVMPCVLPLLSVKAMNLLKQQDKNKKSILLNSFSYAAGILASMWIVAIIVIILQSSGKLLGWGFQFQSPWFLFFLILLVFAFSLSLFEVFMIQLPLGQNPRKREGYAGSFFTGIFAVLVATPCTAPFMGTALGFAFTQSPLIILTIFTALGLGFSSPFILLGFFPAFVKKLPKPGNWMVVFQQFMGFVLMATSLYLLSTLYNQIGPAIISVLLFLLLFALSLWVFGKGQNPQFSRSKKWLIYGLALIMTILSAVFFVDLQVDQGQSTQDNNYIETFNPAALEALLAKDEPVFLEFTAQWCTTCKVNHKNVLDTEDFLDGIKERGIHYIQGDYTLPDDEITKWLRKYDRAGVPLYIYYEAGNEPYIFPELLSREMVFSIFDK